MQNKPTRSTPSRTLTRAAVRVAAVGFALTRASTTIGAQQVGHTPVIATIPAPPASITALGRSHIVYELRLTNFGAMPISLEALNVIGDDKTPVEQLSGARLAARVSIPGQTTATNARTETAPSIPVGATAVVFMWTSLAPGATLPTTISNQLVLSSPNSARRDTLTLAPAALRTAPQAAVAPPVHGGPWIAIRGPSNTSGHRLSIVTLDGAARIPQRFAVDWGKLGDDGRLFHGDSTKNSAWYGYGDTVFAATAGRVSLARDGMPDNVPFASAPAIVEADAATGNLIAIEAGAARFAQYAHLKPGSLRVKVGDMVREGQPIALVGNSGNTLGPHLHFQMGDAPELLRSEGLPFALRDFQLVGRVTTLSALLSGSAWTVQPNQPPREVHAESPLENMIVRFANR